MLSRNLIKMVNIETLIVTTVQCSASAVAMFSLDTKLSLLIDQQIQHLQTIRRGSIDAVTDLEGGNQS